MAAVNGRMTALFHAWSNEAPAALARRVLKTQGSISEGSCSPEG